MFHCLSDLKVDSLEKAERIGFTFLGIKARGTQLIVYGHFSGTSLPQTEVERKKEALEWFRLIERDSFPLGV